MGHGPICERCGRMGEERKITQEEHNLLKAIFGDHEDALPVGTEWIKWPERDEPYEPWPEHMRMKGIVCGHCFQEGD